MRAIRCHTACKWVLLYLERWLKAPVQMPDGTLMQQYPFASGVTAYRPHQKLPVNTAKEVLDVDVSYPGITPAPLPSYRSCLMRRPPWAISIRVFMEHRFHERFKVAFAYRLRNSVGDGGHSQRALSACCRYLYTQHRRRKITA